MYFVTTNRKGYVLFSMTPSERAAVGLAEDQKTVQFLVRDDSGEWQVMAEWDGAKFSHTDFMAAHHQRPEPADPNELLEVLPLPLRQRP